MTRLCLVLKCSSLIEVPVISDISLTPSYTQENLEH